MRKYAALWLIAARNSAVYSGDVLGRAGFFILIVFILSQVYRKLLAGGPAEGFGYTDIVWYLIFTEALLLAVPPFETNVEEEIRSGAVAYQVARPVHYLGYHLATYSGEASMRLGANVLIGGAFALFLAGSPPTPLAGLPVVILAAALGLLLHFHLLMCIALLGFWFEETKPFFWIYQKILFTAGGLMIPLELLPDWLRRWLDFLPFASVLYAPARLGVRYEPGLAASLVASQLLWLALSMGLAHAVYMTASRRLQINGG